MSKILIIFDTETTGLSADNGDRIVEIGAIKMIDGKISDEVFHYYLNPERLIPIESTRIHGITNAKVKNSPKFANIAKQFLEFIGNGILVAHNAKFDIKFINMELSLINLPPLSNEVEDTLKIAKKKFPGAPASLDALCKRFKVDLTERTFHGALLDSKLLACIYRKMVINDQSDIEFNKKDLDVNDGKAIRSLRESLCIIEENERNLHLEFIIKYGFWGTDC